MQQWNNFQKITKTLWKQFYSIGMIVYFQGGKKKKSLLCFRMAYKLLSFLFSNGTVQFYSGFSWNSQFPKPYGLLQIKLAYGKQCKHTSHFSTCESTEVLWYTFLRFSTIFSVSLYFQPLFVLLDNFTETFENNKLTLAFIL